MRRGGGTGSKEAREGGRGTERGFYFLTRAPTMCSASSPPRGAPLILLSPAKTLNFEDTLSSALASATPTRGAFLAQAARLAGVAAALTRPQLKALMGLSDSLAQLNHRRYAEFEAQPERVALGAFEGAAYKGLDAPSLAPEHLEYLQSSLRILCGLYGIVRPLDQIRPYRMEMSTRLKVDEETPNLYAFWGSQLTEALAEEIKTAKNAPSFVLNVASQEYAKAVDLTPGGGLPVPVVTVVFPGPAVHAKTARGAMVRFCALNRVCKPQQLKEFSDGWRFVPSASTETKLVYQRVGPNSGSSSTKRAPNGVARKPARAPASEPIEEESAASRSGSRMKRTRRA